MMQIINTREQSSINRKIFVLLMLDCFSSSMRSETEEGKYQNGNFYMNMIVFCLTIYLLVHQSMLLMARFVICLLDLQAVNQISLIYYLSYFMQFLYFY